MAFDEGASALSASERTAGLSGAAPRNASVHARGPVEVVSLSRSAFSLILHHTGLNTTELANAIYTAAQGG